MAKLLDMGPAILTCCGKASANQVTKAKKKTSMEFLEGELYLGFSATEPNADLSNFTEPPKETGYQRQKWNDKRFMGWAGVGFASNGEPLTFPDCKTGGYGVIAFLGIFDSMTADKPVVAIRLNWPVQADEGIAVQLPAGQLSVPVPFVQNWYIMVDDNVISDVIYEKAEN